MPANASWSVASTNTLVQPSTLPESVALRSSPAHRTSAADLAAMATPIGFPTGVAVAFPIRNRTSVVIAASPRLCARMEKSRAEAFPGVR